MRKFGKLPAFFLENYQSKHKQQITFSKILAIIVLILILVLVSKPGIKQRNSRSRLETRNERNSRSRLEAQDWKKEIPVLVSKHDIERKQFSFSSQNKIGFSLDTDCSYIKV